MEYSSNIIIGRLYTDRSTGFVGKASAVAFYEHGPERIQLEALDNERMMIRTDWFDAPQLV